MATRDKRDQDLRWNQPQRDPDDDGVWSKEEMIKTGIMIGLALIFGAVILPPLVTLIKGGTG